MSAYVLGHGDGLVDLLNPSNKEGIIADSVKEGPQAKNIDQRIVKTPMDVAAALQAIVNAYEAHFESVLKDPKPDDASMPAYLPDHIVVGLYRFDGNEGFQQGREANSIHFVVLGDCERPVVCGIDTTVMTHYEKNQRILCSVGGVLSAIRCNRLRVPYGKSKLTSLLKRAYNAEKNNPYNDVNQPTTSMLICHLFADDGHAEESFHVLTLATRMLSLMGGIGVGQLSRDLGIDKWRLEQDILELKDELTIARHVHDYKPCIYDQPKPVMNIQEEETKRIAAIQKKRHEVQEKALQDIRRRAQEEANRLISEQEARSGQTLQDLQRMIDSKQAENAKLQNERAAKMKDYEKQLEKIRKKKEEEEASVAQVKEEIKRLEAELAEQQEIIQRKKTQLEAASQDQKRGRDAIQSEREELKRKRAALYEQRRKQREAWLKEIEETNSRVLKQVVQLSQERKQLVAQGAAEADDQADETEEGVRGDIETINEHLPKLISLDDAPADVEATDSIRTQLEAFFMSEREDYARKIDDERKTKQDLEKKIESYRGRLRDIQAKSQKEYLADAVKKERHLQALVDQVLQFLQHGLRMSKISSTGYVRRRFFFLSEDCRRIYACDIDDDGVAINRRHPTTTVQLRDVRRMVLGMYTSSFTNFAGDANLRKARDEAMRNDGSLSTEPTAALTPFNLGRYMYRAFALELRNGKSLEVVCETDSDFEAWVVALKRLLGYRTLFERDHTTSASGVPLPAGSAQPVTDSMIDITWGGPLGLVGRPGGEKLSRDESTFCSEQHIPPLLYLRTKADIISKSQTCLVTTYDVRVVSTLDLMRAQQLHEFLVERRVIPSHGGN